MHKQSTEGHLPAKHWPTI